MGCYSSATSADFDEDMLFQSLPSESSLETLKNTRNSGNIKQRILYLKHNSKDLAKMSHKDVKTLEDKAVLVICETMNPKTNTQSIGPVNDSILTAKCVTSHGFTCYTLVDAQLPTILTWVRIFMSKVHENLIIFYNGFYESLDDTGKKVNLAAHDQLFKFGNLVDSHTSYKLPNSRLSVFIDAEPLKENNFIIEGLKVNSKSTFFLAKPNTFIAYFVWKQLKTNKEISLKDLVDSINSTVEQYEGHLYYSAAPDVDSSKAFLAGL